MAILSLLKFTNGPWEKVRGYLRADLETIQTAINKRWASTFGNTNILPVPAGGTGATTLTTHGLLVGEGTGTVVALPAASNGQIPIGKTGSDPVEAVITPGAGITVTNGAGSITIATASHALLDGNIDNDTLAHAPVRGDIIVGNSTPLWARLPIGASATFPRSNGTDVAYAQVTLTTDVTGILPLANGGTGGSSFNVHSVMLGEGGNALSATATSGTTGQVLRGQTGADPVFGQVVLTTDVTGTLPATNGGTGQAVYAVGDLLTASTTTALSRLADVAVGAYLRSGGVSTTPLWSTLILPNAATTGDLLVASSTNTVGRLADVAVGQVLTSGGVGTVPSYSASLPSGVLNNIIALPGMFTVLTSSSTGAINNFVPGAGISGYSLVTLTGAAPAITGLSGGVAGYIVIFKNTGTGVATFAHNSGASSAGNKLFNILTSAPTPVAAQGYIAYQYDGTQWQLIGHNQGKALAWTPTDASGASLVFSVAAGTYVVDGMFIKIDCQVNYPVTASASNAVIGSLPFTCAGVSGGMSVGFIASATAFTLYVLVNATATTASLTTNQSVAITNAQMTNGGVIFSGTYTST